MTTKHLTASPCNCGTPRPPTRTRTHTGTPAQVAQVVLELLSGRTGAIDTLKETR